jgi:hypothetical protein
MKSYHWRRSAHIPVLIALEIIFIVLFAKFVIYNPESADYGEGTKERGKETMKDYACKTFNVRICQV